MKNHKRQSSLPRKASSTSNTLTEPPDLCAGTVQPRKDDSPPDIFTRLEQRGIDYKQIKRIVQFDRPEHTLRFAQWFKGRTIEQVLNQFEKWRNFLEKDFILSLSSEVKAQLEQFVFGAEWMVWQALTEANPKAGPWDLCYRFLPTGKDENGRHVFIYPSIQLEAVHRETKETRTAQIPGGKPFRPSELSAAFRKAFNDLGLWAYVWTGDPSRDLLSNRSRHAWPVFTKFIIPRLYEFMLPYYKKRPHHSERLDGSNLQRKRQALYPKELLQDMLEVLKMEHSWAFEKATLHGLKGVIQRYHVRKTAQTGR